MARGSWVQLPFYSTHSHQDLKPAFQYSQGTAFTRGSDGAVGFLGVPIQPFMARVVELRVRGFNKKGEVGVIFSRTRVGRSGKSNLQQLWLQSATEDGNFIVQGEVPEKLQPLTAEDQLSVRIETTAASAAHRASIYLVAVRFA